MTKIFTFIILILISLTANAQQTTSKQWTEQGPRGITILKRDTHGTGKADYERHTTSRGIVLYEAIDFSGTGQMDTFYYYNAQGVLERQEIDSNNDGKIDIIIYLRDGTYIESIWKDPAVHPAKSQTQMAS